MTILLLQLGTEGTLDYYFVYKKIFSLHMELGYIIIIFLFSTLKFTNMVFCIMIARDGKDGYTSIF